MIDRDLVTEIVEKNIAETDMFIVETAVGTGNIVSVVLDSDSSVDLDKCAQVNRAVAAELEKAGEDDFELSVYSAGLGEPLRLLRQYRKHIGAEVEIVLLSGEKLKCRLLGAEADALEVEYEVREKTNGKASKKKTVVKKERIGLDSIKSTKRTVKI
jgi:ribosome maturation factor RimP